MNIFKKYKKIPRFNTLFGLLDYNDIISIESDLLNCVLGELKKEFAKNKMEITKEKIKVFKDIIEIKIENEQDEEELKALKEIQKKTVCFINKIC